MRILRVQALATFAILALACEAPVYVQPDVEAVAVSADYGVQLDAAALDAAATLEPIGDAVTVEGPTERFRLHAFAKPAARRDGYVWLDVFVENLSDVGLRDVTLSITADGVRDWTRDPFTEEAVGTVLVGGIAPEGLGRVSLGVPASVTDLGLSVEGVETSRTSTTSAPLALTPDGAELWASFPDGDVVSVIDTASEHRVAEVVIEGRPSSVAVTPDGLLVLVASASANTVSVIDRVTREVVQTFDEEDGVGREPRHLVVSPDGSRAFVSAYVGDRVTALLRRGDRFSVEGHVGVGRRPAGLSVTPDSSTVLVSHFLPRGPVRDNEGWISVLAAAPLEVTREVVIDDHFNVEEAACIADVFGVRPERMTTEGVPTQLAGVFLDPAGNEGWTPGTRAAGAALAWEASEEGRMRYETLVAIRPGELSPPFVFLFDTREPAETERMLLPGALERPIDESYPTCGRFQLEIELVGHDDIPGMEGQQVNRFLAYPAGQSGLTESGLMRHVAFTRGGRRALMLSYVADEIVVYDAATHHPTSRFHFILEGHNPTGIVVSPDGATAYVSYDNSPFVSVLDLSAYADPADLPGPSYVPYEFRPVPEVPQVGGAFMNELLVRYVDGVPDEPSVTERGQVALVDEDPVHPVLREGAILFSSANPRRHPTWSQSSNGACATCHPSGGHDGTMWGTMEGERRTTSLRGGVAGRGWLHASGTHRDIHEFVESVGLERLGAQLTEDEVDALASYVARGIPRLQPPEVDVELASRGESLFADNCAGCHRGEALTSGNPDPDDPWGGGLESPELYDVGTASDDAGVILGTFFESLLPVPDAELLGFLRGDRDLGEGDPVQEGLGFRARPDRRRGRLKAPSLVNVWDNVLFFHDGRFTSADEAMAHLDEVLALGLTAEDRVALAEYLRTL